MNFDSLKEQLRDQALELWGRIQETSLYMNAREKYEALSTRSQKAIVGIAVAIAGVFLLSFPYSYISSSQDSMASFNDNRDLIRNLLKASRTLKEMSPLPPEMTPENLTTMVNRSLDEFHLIAEQIGPANPIEGKVTGLVPGTVNQNGVSLQLKKLNLKQVVEISHRLEILSPGIKLIGLDVSENASASHYFDVIFTLAAFSVPEPAMPLGGKGNPRFKPRNSEHEEKGSDE